MAVEIVIDNEHQSPVKCYFSSARLGAVCAVFTREAEEHELH